MSVIRIEEASLNAWPALEQVIYDGWVLRFSKGFTKRANSVNPLRKAHMDVVEKITYCENTFLERNLPIIFRITPCASPNNLDEILAFRDYKKIDSTSVLSQHIQEIEYSSTNDELLENCDLNKWLETFCLLSGYELEDHLVHREILQQIPATCFYTVLHHQDQIVSCGLGVLERDYFGLFDLITTENRRNQGFGRKLISQMLFIAREAGAKYAYLQVMQNNHAARHLYEKLGFQENYNYWYRVNEREND